MNKSVLRNSYFYQTIDYFQIITKIGNYLWDLLNLIEYIYVVCLMSRNIYYNGVDSTIDERNIKGRELCTIHAYNFLVWRSRNVIIHISLSLIRRVSGRDARNRAYIRRRDASTRNYNYYREIPRCSEPPWYHKESTL